MILKYSEALERSSNKDWFKTFCKESDVCNDQEVDTINKLVKEVGEKVLMDYFGIYEDFYLQKEYYEEVLDYLTDYKNGDIQKGE